MPNGSRVRANNVYGTTTDNPLLIGATSFTSLGLNLLPAIVSPNQHAVIVLDPKRVFGDPEIVVVTAHTAMGTTATITRGTYGTVAREHPQGTAWAHVPVGPDDYTAIVTSGTRPSDPYLGQFLYETDTDSYVGRGAGPVWQTVVTLGAWATYTPTNSNVTVGNGTEKARFVRSGRIIQMMYELTWGNTTAFPGTPAFGLPVASHADAVLDGAVWILDSGTTNYVGVTRRNNNTSVNVFHAVPGSNAGTVAATSPMTWTTGDRLSFSLTYEAAS